MNIATAAPVLSSVFARYTAEHTLISMSVPPSAQYLFQWLLQQKPAGREQEIDLEAYQAFTGKGRARPYSFKIVRSALDTLIEVGLVSLVRQYNARFWKVIAYHPGQKELDPVATKTSQVGTILRQKTTSNADCTVPSYREYRETTNTGNEKNITDCQEPPTHPVLKKEIDKGNTGIQPLHTVAAPIKENQETREIKAQDPPHTPPDKPKLKPQNTSDSEVQTDSWCAALPAEIEAQIIKLIAPAPLNQNLRKQVLVTQAEVIGDAIAAIQQQIAAGKVKNPIGSLISALKNKWKPNPTPTPITPLIPDDFNEWFELAQRANLVLASSMRDGVLHICTRTQDWEPYEDFRAGFTLPWLKRTLGIPIPE